MIPAAIHIKQRMPQLLAAALGVKPESIRARALERSDADGILEADGHRFVLEAKSSSDAASIDRAIQQLRTYLQGQPAKAIGVVVVPYMGDVGRRMCREAGLGWLDLAGNAFLNGPGLRASINRQTEHITVLRIAGKDIDGLELGRWLDQLCPLQDLRRQRVGRLSLAPLEPGQWRQLEGYERF